MRIPKLPKGVKPTRRISSEDWTDFHCKECDLNFTDHYSVLNCPDCKGIIERRDNRERGI